MVWSRLTNHLEHGPSQKQADQGLLGAEQEGQTEHTGQFELADSSGEKNWLSANI